MFVFIVDTNVLTIEFSDLLTAFITGHYTIGDEEAMKLASVFNAEVTDEVITSFTMTVGVLENSEGESIHSHPWPSDKFGSDSKGEEKEIPGGYTAGSQKEAMGDS